MKVVNGISYAQENVGSRCLVVSRMLKDMKPIIRIIAMVAWYVAPILW